MRGNAVREAASQAHKRGAVTLVIGDARMHPSWENERDESRPRHASSLSRPENFLLPSSARSRPGAGPTEGGFIGRTARLIGALRGGLTAFACSGALLGVVLSDAKGAGAIG